MSGPLGSHAARGLRRKRDSKGEISKYKARCVYNDKRRVNRTLIETFSPAVRHTTVKASVACSVLRGRRRLSFDVTGAYLQGEYSDDEVVYARPPKGYETFDDRGVALVWRMHVPLYGQGDAGLIWFRTIREQLTQAPESGQAATSSGSGARRNGEGIRCLDAFE